MSQPTAYPHNSAQASDFLREAHRNLRLLRAMYGSRSGRYQHLLRVYRQVADNLGCRRELERAVHVLRPRPTRNHGRRWPTANAPPAALLYFDMPRMIKTTRHRVAYQLYLCTFYLTPTGCGRATLSTTTCSLQRRFYLTIIEKCKDSDQLARVI